MSNVDVKKTVTVGIKFPNKLKAETVGDILCSKTPYLSGHLYKTTEVEQMKFWILLRGEEVAYATYPRGAQITGIIFNIGATNPDDTIEVIEAIQDYVDSIAEPTWRAYYIMENFAWAYEHVRNEISQIQKDVVAIQDTIATVATQSADQKEAIRGLHNRMKANISEQRSVNRGFDQLYGETVKQLEYQHLHITDMEEQLRVLVLTVSKTWWTKLRHRWGLWWPKKSS